MSFFFLKSTIRTKTAVFIFALGLAVIVFVWLALGREPRYEGRAFSHWLHDYNQEAGAEEQEEILDAFRSFGRPGVERLVSMCFPRSAAGPYLKLRVKATVFWKRYLPLPHDLEDAQKAISILSGIRPPAEWMLPRITPYCHSTNRAYSGAAVVLLGFVGNGGEQSAPLLAEALNTGDYVTKRMAIQSLRQLGPTAKTAVPELIRQATNAPLQYSLLGALGSIGPGAAEAIPVIRDIMKGSTSSGMRMEGAGALVRISPGDHEALTLLLEEFTKGTPRAAWCLALAGSAAKSALPVLLNYVGSRSQYLWGEAAYAIARIGTADDIQRAETILLSRLPSTNPITKLNLAQSLLILNRTNQTAIAALIEVLGDKDWRGVAVSQLRDLRDPPDEVFSALRVAAADKDLVFRSIAVRALHVLEYRKRHRRKLLTSAPSWQEREN